MFGPEVVDPVQCRMELFRAAEFFPAGNGHFLRVGRVGVIETLLEGVELHEGWDLNFGGDSPTDIRAECSGVPDGKAVGGLDFDLILLAIDFSHAFDFPEADGVTVRQPMLLLIVEIDDADFFLRNSSHMNRLPLFPCGVEHLMSVSIIDEGVAIESEVACEDEADAFGVAGVVEIDEIVPVVAVDDDDALVIGGTWLDGTYMNPMSLLLAMSTTTLGFRSFRSAREASALVDLPM